MSSKIQEKTWWGKINESKLIYFAGVGLLSTILDFLFLNLCLRAHFPLLLAGFIGFFVGFTNGYLLNSRYVFAHASREAYLKYLLVSLGGLLITEGILDLLSGKWGMKENLAKLIAVLIVFVWNYLLSKTWVFQSQPRTLG